MESVQRFRLCFEKERSPNCRRKGLRGSWPEGGIMRYQMGAGGSVSCCAGRQKCTLSFQADGGCVACTRANIQCLEQTLSENVGKDEKKFTEWSRM